MQHTNSPSKDAEHAAWARCRLAFGAVVLTTALGACGVAEDGAAPTVDPLPDAEGAVGVETDPEADPEAEADADADVGVTTTMVPTSATRAPNDSDAGADPGAMVPAPELVAGPELTTTDRFASFSFSGDELECRLDDGAFEACHSPVFFADVGEGRHTFTVQSVAGSGADVASSFEWDVLDLWENPTSDLIAATKQPDAAEPRSWRGIFRINCDFSHSSYDDPIVFPGDEGAAHLHRFYGNTEVDFTTTLSSLYGDGVSTCQGNELNLSAYWVPALLSPDDESTDGWDAVPAVVGGSDEAHEVFYYSAGVDDLDSIQPIPAGLRIIAGDATATPDDPQDTSIVRWHCQSWEANDATNPQFSATIPECAAPDRVRMDIFFPSCWNGIDLDSDDHQSHMAYPVQSADGETVCPGSHPVPIVRPSYHYAFGVKPDVFDPATQASTGWRLSADSYTVDADNPGGASLHADWFNGWHPSVMEAILETCIQDGLDCHDGNLANGYRLSDVQEGAQNDPEVVNDGLGDARGMHEMGGDHGDHADDANGSADAINSLAHSYESAERSDASAAPAVSASGVL